MESSAQVRSPQIQSPQIQSNQVQSKSVQSKDIRIGTAGWSYKDWDGIFYPSGMSHRKQHPLEYLARFFDTTEINTSFYGPLKPEWAKLWCRKVAAVNENFLFTAKLYRAFTHSPIAVMEPASGRDHLSHRRSVESPHPRGPRRRRQRRTVGRAAHPISRVVTRIPLSIASISTACCASSSNIRAWSRYVTQAGTTPIR